MPLSVQKRRDAKENLTVPFALVGKYRSSLSRSGVEPPTGKLHPRESRGTADGKQGSIKKFILGDAFPDLELREIFGGGGSFRSGVQPPTGSGKSNRPFRVGREMSVVFEPVGG